MRKSTLFKVAVVALGVLVVADTVAEAQRRQRGRQRGRGGRGGIGNPLSILENEALVKELKLTKDQQKRIQEIKIQMMGTRALEDEKIQQQLGISESQVKAISEARSKVREKVFGQLRRGGNNGAKRPDFGKLMEDYRKQSVEAVNAVLTSSQRKKFEGMKGKPFDTSQLMQRRGFGGRRPGGDGNRNRGRKKKRPDV